MIEREREREREREMKRGKEKLGRNEKEEEVERGINKVNHSMRHMSTYWTRPSLSAGVSSIILVTKIPGSPSMWGLSDPPAMLRPRPPFSPCEGT